MKTAKQVNPDEVHRSTTVFIHVSFVKPRCFHNIGSLWFDPLAIKGRPAVLCEVKTMIEQLVTKLNEQVDEFLFGRLWSRGICFCLTACWHVCLKV